MDERVGVVEIDLRLEQFDEGSLERGQEQFLLFHEHLPFVRSHVDVDRGTIRLHSDDRE